MIDMSIVVIEQLCLACHARWLSQALVSGRGYLGGNDYHCHRWKLEQPPSYCVCGMRTVITMSTIQCQ